MSKLQHKQSFILSGGGTGGHIFPAISIANEIKSRYPDASILFVGAKDRMEMQRVPKAGYPIKGIWISGIQRTKMWKNLSFPFKLISSIISCYSILRKNKPNAVIGTGGFASGPLMYVAQRKGIPTFIQEQNSYPGITNKLLAKNAKKICVAYNGLDRFFDKNKIILTGNPIRDNIKDSTPKIANTETHLLILGGSLGARSINEQTLKVYEELCKTGIKITWQCGSLYYNELVKQVKPHENLILSAFIDDMNDAYRNADIIVSRAGAGTISELCLVGKPVILIPSPNVAEDHQTKNAQAISQENAAILLAEKNIDQLKELVLDLHGNTNKRQELGKNIKNLAKPDATKDIVNEIISSIS